MERFEAARRVVAHAFDPSVLVGIRGAHQSVPVSRQFRTFEVRQFCIGLAVRSRLQRSLSLSSGNTSRRVREGVRCYQIDTASTGLGSSP